MRKLGLFILLFSGLAIAQGSWMQGTATTTNGASSLPTVLVVPNSSVTVCTAPATGGTNTTPCTNKVPLCTDATLGTCNTTTQNPVFADGAGNFGFWVSPGTYDVDVCSPAPTSCFIYAHQTLAAPGGGAGVFTTLSASSVSVSGAVTAGTGAANTSIVPRLEKCLDGTSLAYLASQTGLTPSCYDAQWNGTPQTTAAYGDYVRRIDLITKPSVDVQSSVGLGVIVTAHSTNTGGAATYNNTAQVAIVANATAFDSTSSAPVEAINAIAQSNYTFGGTPVPQHVIGFEADYVGVVDAGAEGSTVGPLGIGVLASNNSAAAGTDDGTFGFLSRGVDSTHGWKSNFFAGRLAGVAAGTSTGVTPDVDFWARNATSWGFYCGSRAIESATFFNSDMTLGNPSLCYEVGETGPTSAASNKIRISSRDGGSAQHTWDVSSTATNILQLAADGANKVLLDPSNGIQSLNPVTPITAAGTTAGTTALPFSKVCVGASASNTVCVGGTFSGNTNQNVPQAVVLTAAYTNATTTFSTVTGMSWAVAANTNYTMTCQLLFNGSVTTAGPKFQLSIPASPTASILMVDGGTNATTYANAGASQPNPVTVLGTLGAGGVNFVAHVSATLINGANAGTLILQAAANGAGTLTIPAGGYCVFQ